MPIRYDIDGGALAGAALRARRGAHNLVGSGQLRRLGKIVPTHAVDNGTQVLLRHAFVEWLSAPLLYPTDAVRALKVYKAMASAEAMGRAIERALSKLQSDLPLSPAVLRGRLRLIAVQDIAVGASGSGDYTLDVPDTYELSESGFPTGENIDDKYDWIGCLSYDDLAQDGDSLVIYGDLAAAMSPRFDSTEATKVGSIYDLFAVSIEKATKQDEQDLYTELGKEELAVEIGNWLRRLMPVPDELSYLSDTTASARISLRRYLLDADGDEPLKVTAANAVRVIQHYEPARLVIGNNAGGAVVLSMLNELLRLALNTNVNTIPLGLLATGMQQLEDLLPALRSDRLAALPPAAPARPAVPGRRVGQGCAPRAAGGPQAAAPTCAAHRVAAPRARLRRPGGLGGRALLDRRPLQQPGGAA